MEPNRLRVLLVEDDEDDYVLIKDLLSRVPPRRFDLEWVHDYDAGMEAIGDRRHDVCLLDYHLGERDGLEFLREAMANGCHIPVILLSGQGDYTVDMEAMYIGAADYLTKGQIDATLLERSIRYAISHKRLEEQIREASRLASIGKLAAGVAHEINNPLTSVLGYSQLLMAEDLPGPIIADLRKIYGEARRAAKIVQDLLLFARKTVVEKQYWDIMALLERAQEIKSHDFKANQIKVITEVSPDLPRTMADEHQLIQVFLNILANAEQGCLTSHGKGQLLIHATSSLDKIRVSISDDGPGIPPENLNRIFEPFFTTKGVGRGTGLGLSICYGIIREHGGHLWAESEPGKGATFHIELPVVAPEGEAQVLSGEPTATPAFSRCLLVVDDEPLIRNLLAKFLGMQGFAVDLAEEGEEAWRKLQSMTYDCILLDLNMPGMGGRELYQTIEASATEVAKKVIFITGDTVNSEARDFIEATGNPVMTKPFELEELHHQILELVG